MPAVWRPQENLEYTRLENEGNLRTSPWRQKSEGKATPFTKVFGQIPIYVSSTGQWDLWPELPSHLDPNPSALMAWLKKHRLPHFCKSSFCLHLVLCQKLLGFIRFSRLADSAEALAAHSMQAENEVAFLKRKVAIISKPNSDIPPKLWVNISEERDLIWSLSSKGLPNHILYYRAKVIIFP
ncbi:LOW QUALITY PROTEIN: regulator of G-protein signaling protein-like [Chlamydotis macqueenii]